MVEPPLKSRSPAEPEKGTPGAGRKVHGRPGAEGCPDACVKMRWQYQAIDFT
jgi:hypothetical protein